MSFATAFEYEDELELEILHFDDELEFESGRSEAASTKAIALRPVPGQTGVNTGQLIESWRKRIVPEVPMPVLLAFIHFESGGDYCNATHSASGGFYELGIFQTPAGQYGRCASKETRNACAARPPCTYPPPGHENPRDPSSWIRLCRKINQIDGKATADPNKWTDPTVQVRAGLMDLKTSAQATAAKYPDLFRKPGSDWYLRMAVLLPFARGGGFASAFLHAFHNDLARLPESGRWNFLRGKQVNVKGKRWSFDASNVDKKMTLAGKIGYIPAP
jgi:hypothetical protein